MALTACGKKKQMSLSLITDPDRPFQRLFVQSIDVKGDFSVQGDIVYDGGAEIKGNLTVDGDAAVAGAASVGGVVSSGSGFALPPLSTPAGSPPALPAEATSSLVFRGSDGRSVLGSVSAVPLPSFYAAGTHNASGFVNSTFVSEGGGYTDVFTCPTGAKAVINLVSIFPGIEGLGLNMRWSAAVVLNSGDEERKITGPNRTTSYLTRATLKGTWVFNEGERLRIYIEMPWVQVVVGMYVFKDTGVGTIGAGSVTNNPFNVHTARVAGIGVTPVVLYTAPSVNPLNGLAVTHVQSIGASPITLQPGIFSASPVVVYFQNGSDEYAQYTVFLNGFRVARCELNTGEGGSDSAVTVATLLPGDVITVRSTKALPLQHAWCSVIEL